VRDQVKVADRLRLMSRDAESRKIEQELIADLEATEKDKIYADGYLSMVCRERGKIVPGTRRFGHNVWTLTGREHLSQLQSYSSYGPPAVGARNDRIRYIGFGVGSQPEVASVTSLVSPIAFDASNNFLAQVSLPTFPLAPSRTAVRYSRTFTELELSVVATVTLTEAGLYTDGDPGTSFDPETRDITLTNALLQAPNSYKVFEPLSKSQNFVLEVSWEVRF
jgi:hypothetical protein